MQMTNSEIIRRYKQAENRRKMIRILAELNACPKEEIRKILREAGCDVPATGNRYTAKAKKAAEETEADGSKRKQAKLTAKAKRLLKNEEPTDSSDLSTRLIRSDESTESSDLSAPENVGTHQQEVGTKSEKKAAPTACQPAQPVDVWGGVIALSEYDEDTIRFAEDELRGLNGLIEGLEIDIRRKKLEIQANKCKAEYLRLWLRNVKGGTEA